MATSRQEVVNAARPDVLSGEEIVISGISGLFPKSDNVTQFMENLYNHVDMVDVVDYSFKHRDFPKYAGKISGLNKFDAPFFRVPFRQASCMDGMGRKVLEQAYGAIFDAGINPASLAGKNLGVFVGSSSTDDTAFHFGDMTDHDNYLLTEGTKALLANRISYWIDSNAISYTINHMHASSSACLEHAYRNISNGRCEAAIVGGCNEVSHPMLTLNYRKAGFLNLDGKTKCFDKNGDGYVRSACCGILFLQKAKDAKRIYAQVCCAKEKYLPSQEMSLTPVNKELEIFWNDFYSDIDVSPELVEYVEAAAPGIAKADGNELEAIGNVFAKTKIIKVGSVNSNMGHGEAASGICQVIKICLANHTGKLPANLHYYEPQNNITVVKEGRIEVVTENTRYNRGYIALNSFNFSGTNVHILLKGNYKEKDTAKYKTSIPRLVLVSGRTKSCTFKIINHLKTNQVDPEEIALLHNFFNDNISGHTTRGFVLLDEKKNTAISESTQHYPGIKRPVWFVYSGMGSQWPTMGAALMRLPIFATAIEKCHKTLRPKGVDIVKILTDPNKNIFDNILNAFVSIAAVQIGLTDILTALGVVPDNIIGHSLGELGCAYADGCFTAEEMILASYYRGLVSIETTFCKGAMAVVGLGYKDILPICPPEIDVACHNSSKSCTISGPVEDIKNFIANLTSQGIVAREFNTSNIAYHSRYIVQAGDPLLSYMKPIIKSPKLRSKKWLSTSVLPENWNKYEAKYCSPEYFTNNLLNSVYFEEVAKMIPSNAIVIEVSPHGLMQAILRRSHENCIHVPLTRRGHNDSIIYLLKAIGTLYESGLNPKIDVLYPTIDFPVSTTTPMISHLVEWEYSIVWPIETYKKADRIIVPAREINLSIHDDDWSFIKDHVRDGVTVIPEAVIIFLVWETFGMYLGIHYKNLSVSFTDIEFHGAVDMENKETLPIHVHILKGSGRFEVTYLDLVIASGYIARVKFHEGSMGIKNIEKNDLLLDVKDVYTIMNSRGHSYGPGLRSIQTSNVERTKAQLKWNGDWMMLLDSLLQLGALASDYTGVTTPKCINKININTIKNFQSHKDNICLATVTGNESKIIQCEFIDIYDIVYQNQPTAGVSEFILEYPKIKVNDTNKMNCENMTANDIQLTIKEIGDIDKLSWVTFTRIHSDGLKDGLVKVCYAGISAMDCHVALGKITRGGLFGMDYSGINTRQERVMGVVYKGALASSVEADLDLLWPVPEHWSLEDAATVLLPYLHAYYSLTIRSDIQRNHNVLIMDAASMLGQACVSLCLYLNCKIFATVFNIEEKKFLLRTYPGLEDNNINNIHSTFFQATVSEKTNKLQCDYVINCGTGESWKAGLKCVGLSGIFLDIVDVPERKDVGMYFMTCSRNFIPVHLLSLFKSENSTEKKVLQARISEGIARGVVRPLSRVVYSPADITKAFKLSYSIKHVGRVLISMTNLERSHHKIKTELRLNSLRDTDCRQKTEIKRGLKALFSYFDEDVFRATEPVVVMPTNITKFATDDTITGVDPSETYLMMVPGFGGHHDIYTSICTRVKIPSVTLQLGTDCQDDTIPQAAKRIMINIKQTMDLKTKFYILGYSFGVNIALELASLIEKEGNTGIVYCLDSSPEALKIQLNEYLGDPFDERAQNSIIEHMYHIISGRDSNELGHELKEIDNWTDKVEFCVRKLKCLVGYSQEYMRSTIQEFYNKIVAARDYEPTLKLQSELVLLRSTRRSPDQQMTSLGADYELSKYSEQPVRVFDIESDHAAVPHDFRVANIVNRLLEPRILEEYKQNNLCESYASEYTS